MRKLLVITSILILVITVLMLPGCCNLLKNFSPEAKTGAYPVTVDYNLSLQEMIQAGNYDWAHPDIFLCKIVEGNPADREGQEEVQLDLVCFNETLSTEIVLKRMDEAGYRPATLAELLAFGARYPDKQTEFPIVALGSVFLYPKLPFVEPEGSRRVARLSWLDSKRDLSLPWIDRGWDARCRFLVAHK